jgi:hypothetical protein
VEALEKYLEDYELKEAKLIVQSSREVRQYSLARKPVILTDSRCMTDSRVC